MEKRYQVFISSTYADLQDERQEVMQALLELDCIPSGMELFPAANEDQWSLIKRVIDDCDYYVVILGGRYGTIGPDGKSYTEMEYRYALDREKPILGFIHKDPGSLPQSRCESTENGKVLLGQFRDLIQKKMCRFWVSPSDLGSQVSRSLVQMIKAQPAIGWVRGDTIASASATEEILSLKNIIEQMKIEIDKNKVTAPESASSLAQGEDEFEISYTFIVSETGYRAGGSHYRSTFTIDWDSIFYHIGPHMIHEATDHQLYNVFGQFIREYRLNDLNNNPNFKNRNFFDFEIAQDSYQTIIIQLRALGMIVRSAKPRSVKNTSNYWTLTSYGDNYLTRLRAIRKVANNEKNGH